ncbi:hypothetical protein J2858_000583 [Neorhizobium galegae]|uniref:hypothetical protein n=1 Tax=Neorhizobium galegae TaxID=399 RepID=UPI001AEA1207|nr:hypothetical protein [Neorhizobium galegae]MBP2547690.1 hypothetical protein [Neorhizobium galegae]
MRLSRPLLPLLICVAAGLAGCQTMTPEERRAADERTCAGYGFRPATDAMARCLLDLDLDRRADMRAFQTRSMMFDQPVILERRVIVDRR